jgi:transcriptional regulator with XRE-family HTH domain
VATIGAQIREARKAAGYRNAEMLAVELGIGVRTVQRYEADQAAPSIERLLAIARLTDKPLAYFLSEGVAA